MVAWLEVRPGSGWRWGMVEVGVPACGQLSHATGQLANINNNAHALATQWTVLK